MDYQGNTNKDKEKNQETNKDVTEKVKAPKDESDRETKLEKVVSGEVVTRKKPLGKRVKELFLGGEFKSAGQYLAAEVLLPAFRNLLVDATTKGVERVVYGDSSLARGRAPSGYSPKVTYNTPINRGYSRNEMTRANLPDQPSRPRPRNDGTELILASRSDAEMVLERLQDVIDRYQVASLADLHELAGIPTTYLDNKLGWESLRFAEIRQVREGYLLDLPPTEHI